MSYRKEDTALAKAMGRPKCKNCENDCHWACLFHPRYSSDIKAAWTLIEELDNRAWLVSVSVEHSVYSCEIRYKDTGSEYEIVAFNTASSAPEAIALAALEVL